MMMASSTQTQLISQVAGEVMTIISQWAFIFMCLQYFACGLYFSQGGGGGGVVFCGRCFFSFCR